jgi:hypothetical protein
MAEPTNFAESNALLAMMEGGTSEASRILNEMLPGELVRLARAADRLDSLAWQIHDKKLIEAKTA